MGKTNDISAIENYRANLPDGKFILIIDEADDMFRTIDKHQVFEKALQNLLNLKPSMASTQSLAVVYFYQTMLTFFLSYQYVDCHGLCDPNSSHA